MEATISVTIEIPVTFTAIKGYPATQWEPGEPDQVEDIQFDHADAISAIETALEDDDIDSALLSEAEESGHEWETERAEFKLFQDHCSNAAKRLINKYEKKDARQQWKD